MKRFKSAISILLCMAMLVSICVIGASAEGSVIDDGEDDVITTEGYSMSFNFFIGSGGNVLIVGLQGLTLSDTTDLTITWFDGGNPCFSFAEDEIIVEQPNEYHNDIELYLKSENLPSDNDMHFCNVRIESGSLTDSNGGAVNTIEEDFSLRPLDYSPKFYYYNPETYDLYVGSYLSLHYDDYSDRYNGFTVTTETPETLSVRDNTTLEVAFGAAGIPIAVGTTGGSILGAIAFGYECGSHVSEALFNMDDISDNLSMLIVAGTLASVAKSTLIRAQYAFEKSEDYYNANVFHEAFTFYKNVQTYSMTKYLDYLTAKQEAFLGKLLAKNDKTIAQMNMMLNVYKMIYCHYGLLDEQVTQTIPRIRKVVKIACPVDVYVYNNGILLVSVVDNVVSIFDDTIVASVVHDKKYFSLPDYDCFIKIVSTGSGKMDCDIYEYNNSCEQVRDVGFSDISLTAGEEYSCSINNQIYTDAENYNIKSNGGKTFECSSDDRSGSEYDINFGTTSLNVVYKQAFGLTVFVDSSIPSIGNLQWTTSDSKVLTVDKYGTVIAVGKGTATLTAMVEGTDIKTECDITVKYAWWQWLIKILLFGWIWY